MRPRVVILGAGPGGLAAAHELARAGAAPLVLEKQPHVGGLCQTVERHGFRFDFGGHRWFTKNEELDRWFHELMRDELVRVPRVSRIYFDGKFWSYPIDLRNVLANAGWTQSAEAVCSYLAAQLSSRREPENIEEAYVRQFGRKLHEMFFRRYSEKVWGRPCREISADWVTQRTKGLSVWEAAKNAVGRKDRGVASLAEEFFYPSLGYQRICERMREDVEEAGGEVRLGATFTSLDCDENSVRAVQFRDAAGIGRSISADAVISTVPLPHLLRALSPAAPHEAVEAVDGLQFRGVITVNLMLGREHVTDDTWLYIHDPAIPFARLHEPRNWSAAMAPAERTSLVAEIFCDPGDALWEQTDEQLCALTVHHLAHTLGFIAERDVLGSFAMRAAHAYPVYTLDYHARLQRAKAHFARYTNLQLVGRGGTFRYNNADHSVEMGLLAASNFLGGSHRIDAVNESPEYLEEKRLTAAG